MPEGTGAETVTLSDGRSHPLPWLNMEVAGEGETVVLVHGGLGSWKHWVRNIEPLSKVCRVHALDQLAYGESGPVEPGIGSDDYLELTYRALLKAFPGDEPITFVGFSFGASTAGDMARRFGSRTRRLAVMGPAGLGSSAARKLELRSYKAARHDPALYRDTLRHNLLQLMLAHPETVDESTLDIQQYCVEKARYDSRRVSWKTYLKDALPQLTCPVMLIWGELDTSAVPSIAARTQLVLDARPDTRVELIRNAGHWVQYEAADAVNRLLADFIATT